MRNTADAAVLDRHDATTDDDAAAGTRAFLVRHWSGLATLAGVTIAGALLYRTLSGYSADEILSSIAAVPLDRLAAAGGFAAASYACLTGFDYLGLRYAGRPLAYPKAALASFTSLSLGHTIGFSALSSGAIRYRFYARWGLDHEEVAKVVLFCAVTVAAGLLALAGIGFLVESEAVARLTGLDRKAIQGIGGASLALVAAYLGAVALVGGSLKLWKWRFRMPALPLAAMQVAVGTLNFTMVAACLYQCIAAASEASFSSVAAAYVVANAGAMLAHVPGGVGVIEGVVSHLLPGAGVIGGVLVFRFVYYLAPLMLGILALGASESLLRRRDDD